jgi:hypothetical protein
LCISGESRLEADCHHIVPGTSFSIFAKKLWVAPPKLLVDWILKGPVVMTQVGRVDGDVVVVCMYVSLPSQEEATSRANTVDVVVVELIYRSLPPTLRIEQGKGLTSVDVGDGESVVVELDVVVCAKIKT